jgi:hypothetical protein
MTRRSLSTGALSRAVPERELRKWEKGEGNSWHYRTEMLTITVHGHIDYKDGTLFVSTSPDIGLGRKELIWKVQDIVNAQDQAYEIVRQYCRKMYEELIE